jgi:hypothetical protein
MSTTITPTEQNIEINVNNDVIDINVTNEIVDVNATTQQIDINVAGAYPIPNPVLSVFGRTGVVVATEGDYTLTQLGDVTLSSPSNGQVLKYNGTNWVNGTDAGGLTSVGLSMPTAFTVTNSPLTSNGTIAVTGAGNATQYVRGDGQLATLPTNGGGGGASVSYYLNGSVNQGTIGGVTYYEMNKTPIIGAGTDFTRSSNGYIASFLTDANDPALLNIPAGNWNFETYFNASSGGGSPTFYIELYKYDGTTFTLIASNSTSPKLINDGTNIEAYFSALAVPQTTLTLTDRLAIRIYVTTAGRTITLHTENGHLCQVITTFTTGLTALNGLTAQVQYLATGTSGTDFNIASATSTHTFNLPTASATNRGALSSADWSVFNAKQNALTNPITGTGTSGQVAYFNGTSSLTSSATFAFTPTSQLLVNNSVTAASAIARGTNLTPTLIAAANSDVLVGLDITPTFTNGAFTGLTNSGIRVQGGASNISPSFYVKQTSNTSPTWVAVRNTDNNAGAGAISADWGISGGANQFFNGTVQGDVVFKAYSANNTSKFFIGATSSTTAQIVLFPSSGNTGLNTTTDAGFRLDVNGTARVQGVLTTTSNATTNQIGTVTNSGDTSITNFGYRNSVNFVRVQSSYGNYVFNSTLSNSGISGIAGNSDSGWYFGTGGVDTKRISITNSNATGGTIYIANNGANVLNLSTSNNVLIGTITDAGAKFQVSGSTTAASAIARGVFFNNTLVAAANNDVLVGLDINPTFTNGAFTGVTNRQIRIQNPALTLADMSFGLLTGGGGYNSSFIQDGNGLTIGHNSPSRNFRLQTNATSRIFIAGGGNVVIGSETDAGFRLDVNGTARVQGDVDVTGLTNYRIRLVEQVNSRVVQFNTNGSSGGYGGGYEFQTGGSGSFGTTTALRIWSNSATNNRVGIGNLTENNIQNSPSQLYVRSQVTGGRNAAIRMTPAASLVTTEYNGIQFDNEVLSSSSGAFIGTQYNPLTSGFDTDLVVLATMAANASYTEVARFMGKFNSLYVGTNKTLAVPSAKLQIESTTQGFLPPRMTTTQKNAISSPATGLVVYDTTLNQISYYNGTTWTNI